MKNERTEPQKAATARLVEQNMERKIARDKARAEQEEGKIANMKEHVKTKERGSMRFSRPINRTRNPIILTQYADVTRLPGQARVA